VPLSHHCWQLEKKK